MAKIARQATNDFCPQTLFLYGTYKEDGTPDFGLFCWFSYCWDGTPRRNCSPWRIISETNRDMTVIK